MKFGASVLPGGGAEFRLWAPAANKVELCLQHGLEKKFFEMEDLGGGWRGTRNDDARHGMLYWYRINGDTLVPDPASRFQPEDALGPSQIIDPEIFDWTDGEWQGRPWEEAIFYELHVGAFTPRGTFDSLKRRLDYIADLGVTAIQMMPVNTFPGRRNWGYDGVLPFAPEDTYGHPESLKSLICEAHSRQLMVFLDVVYNHFGPLGNCLHLYAPQFFTSRHKTPWGDAINFDGEGSPAVRDFFINNALYWLTEYNFDGLRIDASDWLIDETRPDFLTEMAKTIRERLGYGKHLVLENDDNPVEYLRRDDKGRPRLYNAMWDEDLHHCLHVSATTETSGYYHDYSAEAGLLPCKEPDGRLRIPGGMVRVQEEEPGERNEGVVLFFVCRVYPEPRPGGQQAAGRPHQYAGKAGGAKGDNGDTAPFSRAAVNLHGPGVHDGQPVPVLQRFISGTGPGDFRRAAEILHRPADVQGAL